MEKETLYEQAGVAMTCRSFQEYCDMFMLHNELPLHGRILDVASGASSFTAELLQRGYNAIACDPLYRLTADEIELYGMEQLKLATQKLAAMEHAFVWNNYASLEEHDAIRHASLSAFINHYRENENAQAYSSSESTYIAASLPSLPLPHQSFDLILCNHFLFLYQEQFDYHFHLHALLEMLRVAKPGGRILVYPLVGFRDEHYAQLDELITELRQSNASVSLRNTDFRFLPSAEQFLEIIKGASDT